MSTARKLRRFGGPALLFAGLLNAVGCTHNCYYGTGASPSAPAGAATIVPGTVQYGSVCEVPAAESGSSVVVRPSTPVVTSAPPPRVVLSEPNGPSSSRYAWKRADPDSGMITTRVDGNIDAPTIVR